MKTWLGLSLLLILVSGADGVAADGPAYRPHRERDPWQIRVRDPRRSLDEVVSGVRRRNPGKVLSADELDEGGRPVYRIRIMNDKGRVRGLRFDGRTGQPLPPPGARHPRR
jgi:uncharacterized membrane protein YkoI